MPVGDRKPVPWLPCGHFHWPLRETGDCAWHAYGMGNDCQCGARVCAHVGKWDYARSLLASLYTQPGERAGQVSAADDGCLSVLCTNLNQTKRSVFHKTIAYPTVSMQNMQTVTVPTEAREATRCNQQKVHLYHHTSITSSSSINM